MSASAGSPRPGGGEARDACNDRGMTGRQLLATRRVHVDLRRQASALCRHSA
jgi:hypothetical protein